MAALAVPFCAQAQEKPLRNSIGVCSTSIRFEEHDQYLGGGIDYRYMHRSWIGVEVQASQSPEYQLTFEPDAGFETGQADGALLVGHKLGRVGLFAEAGYGVLRARVFGGYQNGQNYDPVRSFQDVLVGGMADVSIQRRWSLTYEVRDNITIIPAFVLAGFDIGGYYPAITRNIPEGRVGVAFHF